MVDTSDSCLVLYAKTKNGNLWVFSPKNQQKYSTYDRELFAIYESIKHFRFMLEGMQFTMFSDYKSKTCAFNKNSNIMSLRRARYLNVISQLSTNIQHVSGIHNAIADVFSRISTYSSQKQWVMMNWKIFKTKTTKELFTQNTSFKLELFQIPGSNNKIYYDSSLCFHRSFVPKCLRRDIFNRILNLSHPGINATVKLVKKKTFGQI